MWSSIKETFQQFFDLLKKIAIAFSIITQLLYIVYLGVILKLKAGNYHVNLILFIASICYFIFYVYAIRLDFGKETKAFAKTLYKYTKKIAKLFNFAIIVYGIWIAKQDASALMRTWVFFMGIGYFFNILFDIIIYRIKKNFKKRED